jgi:oligo-1,6-glucosidase
MAYPFDGVDIATPAGYSLLHFKEVFTRWDEAFAKKGWVSIFLSNHDQARLVSRFGNDKPEFREPSAKMLATFVLTMRGTPFWYNGDELGMSNAGFTTIKEYRDVSALNEYQHIKNTGADTAGFIKSLGFSSRDNGRTPFQWDAGPNAGFTTGIPWISVNPNYKTINEAAQEKDPNSCLNYFRRLTALRKANLVLVYGKYSLLDKDNTQVYAYTREWNGKKVLILLNFSDKPAQTNALISRMRANILLNNYKELPAITDAGTGLKPYQALVVEIPR